MRRCIDSRNGYAEGRASFQAGSPFPDTPFAVFNYKGVRFLKTRCELVASSNCNKKLVLWQGSSVFREAPFRWPASQFWMGDVLSGVKLPGSKFPGLK